MSAAGAVEVAIESIDFYMRNVSMRLPFRYGKACLVAAPLFHVRLVARSAEGATAYGVSADMLPPKWFDKSPEKTYRRNISDLILAAKTGAQAYRDVGTALRTPFSIWQEAYDVTMEAASLVGLNGLTSSFGSSSARCSMQRVSLQGPTCTPCCARTSSASIPAQCTTSCGVANRRTAWRTHRRAACLSGTRWD